MTDAPDTFPVDWAAWRADWLAWLDQQLEAGTFKRTVYRFPAKSFMADAVLGVWHVGYRNVELSEVTFPDLTGERRGETVRYVGVTYGTAAGTEVPEPTGIAASFADLEEILARDCGVTFP